MSEESIVNPRWAAYCKAEGIKTKEAVVYKFIIWMSSRRAEFLEQEGLNLNQFSLLLGTPEGQAEYTSWLENRAEQLAGGTTV